MKILKKNIKLIIILALLLILLLILKILSKNEEVVNEVVPTPTPTILYISPTPISSLEEGKGDPNFYEKVSGNIQNKYPLLDYLPFKSENFTLEYIGPLKLKVILKKDTAVYKQEVLDWITGKEVEPSTHQIIWRTF